MSIKNDQEELSNRFGSLTLLGKEYSYKAGNVRFKDKKALYVRSEISMTKEFINYTTWTREEIETRQEQLAEIALKVWKKN